MNNNSYYLTFQKSFMQMEGMYYWPPLGLCVSVWGCEHVWDLSFYR